VLSLDFPGHGWSEGRDVGFRSYWHVIERLLEHVGLASIVICGLSKGARAGLALAARRPTRVDRIVVVNAFMHLAPDDETKRLTLYDILAQKDGARLWAEQLLNSMGVANRPAIVRGFLKSLDAIDPEHIRSIFRELIAYDQCTRTEGPPVRRFWFVVKRTGSSRPIALKSSIAVCRTVRWCSCRLAVIFPTWKTPRGSTSSFLISSLDRTAPWSHAGRTASEPTTRWRNRSAPRLS
jgi:pimeloyl-ACP methyl ester carboxylesterase